MNDGHDWNYSETRDGSQITCVLVCKRCGERVERQWNRFDEERQVRLRVQVDGIARTTEPRLLWCEVPA